MKRVFEIEAEDVYNYVEYKIIIRNARKIRIRLFLTNLLLKWAKKVFPGTMTIEENTDFVNHGSVKSFMKKKPDATAR
jgi:hypothetical protein